MIEEKLSNLTISDTNNPEDVVKARQHINDINNNLKILCNQHQLLKIESIRTRKNMAEFERNVHAIKEDIKLIEDLKVKLKHKIEENANSDASRYEPDSQLEILIEKKMENYTNLLLSHKQLESTGNLLKEHLSALQRRLESQTTDLKCHENNLVKYQKWIYEIEERKRNLNTEIRAIDDELMAIISGRCDISDEVIMGVKEMVDSKQRLMNCKIMMVNEADETLQNIKEKYVISTECIKNLTEKNIALTNEINAKKIELEDLAIQMNVVQIMYRRIELQINAFLPMQEKYSLIERYGAFEHQLFVCKKDLNDNESAANSYRVKLELQSLEMSKIESNQAKLVAERSQIETRISSMAIDN